MPWYHYRSRCGRDIVIDSFNTLDAIAKKIPFFSGSHSWEKVKENVLLLNNYEYVGARIPLVGV